LSLFSFSTLVLSQILYLWSLVLAVVASPFCFVFRRLFDGWCESQISRIAI